MSEPDVPSESARAQHAEPGASTEGTPPPPPPAPPPGVSRNLAIVLIALVVVLAVALAVVLTSSGGSDDEAADSPDGDSPASDTPLPVDPLLTENPDQVWDGLIRTACVSLDRVVETQMPGTYLSGQCPTADDGVALIWVWSDPVVADTAIQTMPCGGSLGLDSAVSGPLWLVGTSDVAVAARFRERGGGLLTCQ